MTTFIELNGAAPLSTQIYQAFRQAILSGDLKAGASLPPTRALAAELGVGRNTVLFAYEQLVAEGYAVGRVGSGTRVAADLSDIAPVWPAGGTNGGPASHATAPVSGRPPRAPRMSRFARHLLAAFPPPPPSAARVFRYDFRYGLQDPNVFPDERWRRLLARQARALSPAGLDYAPPEGAPALRRVLADYLARARGVACAPEQILVVNGSQQALDLAARVLLDPGDRVVIEEPQYLGARRAFLAAGARLLPVAVGAEGLDVGVLARAAATARLAYVTPSHQFPTGVVMSLARRLALLEWAERSDAYVLEDDYDSEYRYEGRPQPSLQGLDRAGRVVYVGTLSKVLFPALRLGYLVLPAPLVASFVAAKWLTDRQTPTFTQEVLAEFIAAGYFERHLRRTRTRHGARRAALLEALADHLGDRATVVGANAGMHLLVWLPGVTPAALPELVERAAQATVGVYPVTPYYLRPPRRAGLLLGYTGMPEPDIREGIRRLAAAVAALGRRGDQDGNAADPGPGRARTGAGGPRREAPGIAGVVDPRQAGRRRLERARRGRPSPVG